MDKVHPDQVAAMNDPWPGDVWVHRGKYIRVVKCVDANVVSIGTHGGCRIFDYSRGDLWPLFVGQSLLTRRGPKPESAPAPATPPPAKKPLTVEDHLARIAYSLAAIHNQLDRIASLLDGRSLEDLSGGDGGDDGGEELSR